MRTGNRFQFHKGTIKPGAHRRRLRGGANFNSIKVRLNQRMARGTEAEAGPFQFHKGTIKPFRTGARLIAEPDFNSIKVRLNQLKQWKKKQTTAISIP